MCVKKSEHICKISTLIKALEIATLTLILLVSVASASKYADVKWANPADIVYGTALSSSQLNAKACYPGTNTVMGGTYIYSPAAGTILSYGAGQTLHVTFYPSNSNYKSTTASVKINVLKATPTITWANPADIVRGTALSDTQLNAKAYYPGTNTVMDGNYIYFPVAGTVLNYGSGQTLYVTFYPSNFNYKSTTASVKINVLKATPTISWANPADIVYGTSLSNSQLNAKAYYPGTNTVMEGTYIYSPAAGTVLDYGAGQTLSVTFKPKNSYYNPTTVSVKINVLKATPTITWANPADIVYGTALSDTQLNAKAYYPGTSTVMDGTYIYSPGARSVLNVGDEQTLHVDFMPDISIAENYNEASKEVKINIIKTNLNPQATSVPEFPSVVVPVVAILGLILIFGGKKGKF